MAKKFLAAEVFNAKQISRALRKLPTDPELVKALRHANRQVAELFVQPIRRRVPVSTTRTAGKHLRDTVRAGAARTSARVLIGGKKYPYAMMRHAGYRPGGGRTKVKGVPYAREGISAEYKKAVRTYPRKLAPVIKQFNRKYGPVERYLGGGYRNVWYGRTRTGGGR